MMVNRTTMLGQHQIKLANGFWSRLLGLMFRKNIHYGLWLLPCTSIHTFGMRFSIDIVFLDVWGEVVGWVCDVRPRRVVFAPQNTFSVVEYRAGDQNFSKIKKGQRFFGDMICEKID